MDFKESKTIAQQIADRICDEILQGKYPEGERIPSVREYSSCVEVNVNTMVRVYEALQMQQVVTMKRGQGYFVASGAVKRIFTARKERFLHDELSECFRQMDLLGLSMAEVSRLYEDYKQATNKNQANKHEKD